MKRPAGSGAIPKGRPGLQGAGTRLRLRTRLAFALVVTLLCWPGPIASRALASGSGTSDTLADLPLDDLLKIQVTSVSKQEQNLSDSPAAIYVVTHEDIARSGATSIPELLRLVPGVMVGRVTSSVYSITARGFNGQYSNQLLVLVDGRSVYTPLFSGVFWDTQDTVIADIDRIEVIRGPGASVWGANAVNGVINIITKSARDTQGGLLSAVVGTEDRAVGNLRYGGQVGAASYRVYARGFSRDGGLTPAGDNGSDDWNQGRVGFRVDRPVESGNSLTLQGEAYRGESGQAVVFPSLTPPYDPTVDVNVHLTGGNILGRWTHSTSAASRVTTRIYLDRYDRQSPEYGERYNTVDADLQHDLSFGTRHQFTWGASVRYTEETFRPTFKANFSPDHWTNDLYSAFAQDVMHLKDGRWQLTLGSKFERNDYTGLEIQPTVRILRHVGEKSSVWASASRAVHTPGRAETQVRANLMVIPTGGPVVLVSIFGNPNVDSSELRAYETGYRAQVTPKVSLDVATFYNVYHRLITAHSDPPVFEAIPAPAHLLLAQRIINGADASSYGVEIATTWRVTDRWRLSGWYSYFELQIDPDPSGTSGGGSEGQAPKHQAHAESTLDLTPKLSLENALYFVDRLPSENVPKYLRVDLRLVWRLRKDLEASLGGQNLLDRSHLESDPADATLDSTLVERSYNARLKWKF